MKIHRIFNIRALSVILLSNIIFVIATLSTMKLSKMTLSITTFRIMRVSLIALTLYNIMRVLNYHVRYLSHLVLQVGYKS